MSGSGAGIWNTADDQHYVWQTRSGDTVFTARITGQLNSGSWAKTGLMVRAGTDAGAVDYFAAMTAGNGAVTQWRDTAGAGTGGTATYGMSLPFYLRIVRSGDIFTSYTSPDGQQWTVRDSRTLPNMPQTALYGLAVAAFNTDPTNLSQATFDNVTLADAPVSDCGYLLNCDLIGPNGQNPPLHWAQGSGNGAGGLSCCNPDGVLSTWNNSGIQQNVNFGSDWRPGDTAILTFDLSGDDGWSLNCNGGPDGTNDYPLFGWNGSDRRNWNLDQGASGWHHETITIPNVSQTGTIMFVSGASCHFAMQHPKLILQHQPTATPSPTATPTATPSPTATPTDTPLPTATPTDTPTPAPSSTVCQDMQGACLPWLPSGLAPPSTPTPQGFPPCDTSGAHWYSRNGAGQAWPACVQQNQPIRLYFGVPAGDGGGITIYKPDGTCSASLPTNGNWYVECDSYAFIQSGQVFSLQSDRHDYDVPLWLCSVDNGWYEWDDAACAPDGTYPIAASGSDAYATTLAQWAPTATAYSQAYQTVAAAATATTQAAATATTQAAATATATTPTPTPSASATPLPSSGLIPWHPHYTVQLSDRLGASVDLSDGHVDVTTDDLRIPDLAVAHTWDSTLAQAGVTDTVGTGWQSSLSQGIGGSLAGTLTYTDATGATWPFSYTGSVNGVDSYTAPPGQPWQLLASSAGYSLTNILSGETLRFDAQGRYQADTDSYSNSATAGYDASEPGPTRLSNGGDGLPGATRTLALSYTAAGALQDVQSPLWQQSGGTQGQHVRYGYDDRGQLSGITWGADTAAAATAHFGYDPTETQLLTVTTPAGHVWALHYDASNRVDTITAFDAAGQARPPTPPR